MKLTEIPIGDDAPEVVRAVVEIPKGSKNKFEYVPEWGTYLLDRVLAGPLRFPTAYGFIPQTAGVDGDRMDVLVIQDEPTITGCVVEARPLGLLRMRRPDGEDVDEKVLAVSVSEPMFGEWTELDDVPEHLRREIDYFFRTYKNLEGRDYETEWRGAEAARARIGERHREYRTGGG